MDKGRGSVAVIGCLLAGLFLGLSIPGGAVAKEVTWEDMAWKDLVSSDIPKSFPRFIVPGEEKRMALLRDIFHLHYATGDVGSALWHAWIPDSSIWAGLSDDSRSNKMAVAWRKKLAGHFIDAEGYVSSDMGQNFGHALGWPFPHWTQAGGAGWHFTLSGLPDMGLFGLAVEKDSKGWKLSGIKDGGFDEEDGWLLGIEADGATLETPPIHVEKEAAPFLRIACKAEDYNPRANPYVEWSTAEHPGFSPERRAYFTLGKTAGYDFDNEADDMVNIMIPLYKLPGWEGKFTRLRINFGDNAGAKVAIRSIITAVDTRHNVNNFTFVKGCSDYAGWTGDLAFLRENIQRMRLALRWALDEFEVEKYKCVNTPWIGHDGRSGFEILPDGTKKQVKGRGIGNAYFDLLPFGGRDALATIYCYAAIQCMAGLERQISDHPEWNIPAGPLAFVPARLEELAREMKAANGQFWNPETGRFVSAVDVDGRSYDYGFTFVGMEAIHYGYATDEQACSIMDWISGKRIVETDTAKGEDIYHWRFAPRCTTRRNLEYYGFVWTGPETIPWGGQVQDGGAVLGFSYHDLMARIAVYGPDDAWRRLSEILDWYAEVQAGGGYRKYYADIPGASLQGGGTAGGLGLDSEFVENILVPQVMIHGFMGLEPRVDGLVVHPNLPCQWQGLSVTRVDFHSMVCDITVADNRIRIVAKGGLRNPFNLYLPAGEWSVVYRDADGRELEAGSIERVGEDGFIAVKAVGATTLELVRVR